MSPRLQVRGLSVAVDGRRVVDAVDLDIGAGETVGLVGPSGSGKSLTARAVLGLLPPGVVASGSVRLDGRELVGLSERALCGVRGRGLGMVFQEPATALDPVMPIGAQVAEGLRLQGFGHRQARAEALAWLARVGLDPAVVPPDRRPHQLSGGQRQRVAIAAACALGPGLLVADEPTTALDALTQADIARLLAGLARERAMSLLLISHDLALAASLADRLVALRAGRVVAAGPTLEVLDGLRPRHARTAPPPSDTPRAAGGPVVLQAEGLWRRYGASGWRSGRAAAAPGVQDVSLELRHGERLAVVGETGAGKSTLLRLLLGLERPDGGRVLLGGEPFSPAPAARQRTLRRRIQPVFQDPAASFDPRWTVAQIVAEPLALLHPPLAPAQAHDRVAQALTRVGLEPDAALYPARSFSGGQRQRIALARAMVVEPQVLVLDEATAGLDADTRGDVLALLAGLCETTGLACLMVTHDLGVVRGFADRVAVLQHGRIVEAGPAQGVLAAPQQAYTRALVAAAPDLEQVMAARRAAGGAPQAGGAGV